MKLTSLAGHCGFEESNRELFQREAIIDSRRCLENLSEFASIDVRKYLIALLVMIQVVLKVQRCVGCVEEPQFC